MAKTINTKGVLSNKGEGTGMIQSPCMRSGGMVTRKVANSIIYNRDKRAVQAKVLQYNAAGCDESFMLERAVDKEMITREIYAGKDDLNKEEVTEYRAHWKRNIKLSWRSR